MDDAQFVRVFEAGEVPPGGFHHADHVRAAWWYLQQAPLPEALDRFCRALKHFAECRNKPDLYHETITIAYLLLINERLDGDARDRSWPEFAATNGDLLTWQPSILSRYYCDETLASPTARRTFIMPDRAKRATPFA